MQFDYICHNHRHWLIDNPIAAARTCNNQLETGRIFYEQQQWRAALPYIGSAYDISFLLAYYQNDGIDAYAQQFTLSGLLLSNTLLHCLEHRKAVETSHSTEAALVALTKIHPHNAGLKTLLLNNRRDKRQLSALLGQ